MYPYDLIDALKHSVEIIGELCAVKAECGSIVCGSQYHCTNSGIIFNRQRYRNGIARVA